MAGADYGIGRRGGGGSGSVGALPLGTYLKSVLTGQNLPSDLAAEASTSPLLHQLTANEAFTPDL